MTRHEELTHRWRDGNLSLEELEEFRDLLRDGNGRRAVRDEVLLSGAIAEVLNLRAQEGAGPRRIEKPRRERVERVRPRRTGFLLKMSALAAACLALAVGAHSLYLRNAPVSCPDRVGSVLSAGSDARILRAGRPVAIRTGDGLLPGDWIQTGTTGGVRFRWEGEDTTIELAGQTGLGVEERSSRATRMKLYSGSFQARVAPRRADRPFLVVTPHARVRVVGTRFRLRIEKDGTHLRVSDGAVTITSLFDDSSLRVDRGGCAVAKAGGGVSEEELFVVVDNADDDTDCTGAWQTSVGRNPWRTNSLYTENEAARFTWRPVIPGAGTYTVYAYWTYHDNRSTRVPYRIRHARGTDTVIVNQHDMAAAETWQLLGTYEFRGGGECRIEVSGENGQACADAVKVVWDGKRADR